MRGRFRGYIFEGSLGSLAIIAVFYIVITVFGYKKVLVQEALASGKSAENAVYFTQINKKTVINTPKLGTTMTKVAQSGTNMTLKGTINSENFHVKLDTGLGFCDVLISSNLIGKMGLEYTPVGEIWPGTRGGIAYLDQVRVGAMELVNPKTAFVEQYLEERFFGLALQDKVRVSLGLSAIEKFSYVLIDNRSGQVRFSNNDFAPHGESWHRYDMRIDQDRFGQRRLIVTVPVFGVEVDMLFDTCGGEGLKLCTESWSRLEEVVGRKDYVETSVFFAQFGNKSCKKIQGRSVLIGSERYDADIYVLDDGYEYSQDILPLSVFKDTAVVMDLKGGAFWVKQFIQRK